MAGKLTLIKSSNSFPLIKTNVESIRYILSKAYSAFFRTAGGICRRHRPHKCRDIDFVILFEQLAAVRIFRTSTSCKYENRQRNHRQQSEYPA